jgi:hypothetical protein
MKSTVWSAGWPQCLGRLGLLAVFAVVIGCGTARGKVSGRVLYNGGPVPGGRVMFRPADSSQNSVSVELDEQGNYEAVLPVGEVLVSIDNRELEPRAPREGVVLKDLPVNPELKKVIGGGKSDSAPPKSTDNVAKASGRYVPIPSKYYSAESSGLRFTVQGGDQKQDIELPR